MRGHVPLVHLILVVPVVPMQVAAFAAVQLVQLGALGRVAFLRGLWLFRLFRLALKFAGVLAFELLGRRLRLGLLVTVASLLRRLVVVHRLLGLRLRILVVGHSQSFRLEG